jgi:cytochrome P450
MRHVEFLSPGLGENLWDELRRHRTETPVLWVESIQMYCVFGYDHIKTCLTSPDYTVEYPFRVSRQVFGRTLLDMDGPEHPRLRRWLGSLIVGREANTPFVGFLDECVEELLDQLPEQQEFDFVDVIARRLPESVTAAFLGIGEQDRDWVFAHLRYLLEHLDGSSKDFAIASRLRGEVSELVEQLLAHGNAPATTVIGQLTVAVREATLSLAEAVGLVLLVLAAGVETTTGMLANTMVTLSERPDWQHRAASDQATLVRVVREVLRWQPPQLDTVRFARRSTELGGVAIEQGRPLKLLLASGNRDAAVFSQPDEFNPDRPERAALSFGHGPHSCLGMNLALNVASRFFEAFLHRFPEVHPVGPVPPIVGWTFRQPVSLPVSLTGGSGSGARAPVTAPTAKGSRQ